MFICVQIHNKFLNLQKKQIFVWPQLNKIPISQTTNKLNPAPQFLEFVLSAFSEVQKNRKALIAGEIIEFL